MAIIGSRSFTNWGMMCDTLADIIETNEFDVTEIVSGGALGADKMGERAAEVLNVPVTVFKPDWDAYGNIWFRRYLNCNGEIYQRSVFRKVFKIVFGL